MSSHPLDPRERSALPVPATGHWPERADDFSQALVLPVGLVVDRLGPAAGGALVLIRELHRVADRAGFTTLTEPPGQGGAGLSGREACRVLTILSEGDAALGALIALSRAPARLIAAARRFGRGGQGNAEVPLPISDRAGCVVPRGPGQLRLRREGSGWRLSGTTRDTVPGAAIASHAAVECWAETGVAHPVVAIVPLNRPGVRRIAAAQPAGRRAGAAAALAFDDLWLEPERVLDGDGAAGAVRLGSWLRATGHQAEALAALGVARAAHHGATRWRAERGLAPAPSLGRLGRRLAHAERAAEALSVCLETNAGGEIGSVSVQALSLRRSIAQLAVALSRCALLACGGAADAGGVQHMDRTRFHPEKLFRDALADRPAWSFDDRPAARLSAPPPSTRSMSWAT